MRLITQKEVIFFPPKIGRKVSPWLCRTSTQCLQRPGHTWGEDSITQAMLLGGCSHPARPLRWAAMKAQVATKTTFLPTHPPFLSRP